MSRRFSSVLPGPGAGVRLAMVEPSALPDEELLDSLKAECQQLAQQQSRVWAAMAEIGRRAPLNFAHDDQWTPDPVFDSAATEIAAELRVSRRTAQRDLEYALNLQRMPRIAAALRA